MKTKQVLHTFQYNHNLRNWLWFVNNTLVSAFVGALIAFVFGSHYWAALAAFGILMGFLTLLTVLFTLLEYQVSILSILNQGLKDGKYEDVIKFGSAMRTTLFTSNKNDAIVMLGRKIDDAASQIESAHYNNSKGDYLVTIDGSPKSIMQIRIALKIDDLGWSMHLCKRNDEAVDNIIQGIKKARNEALRLSRINNVDSTNTIAPFVQLILRGYRHLSGIYYEDANQHGRATFYENVTKLIMSHYRILSRDGCCLSRMSKPTGTTCGPLCASAGGEKVVCSRTNILDIYFNRDHKACGAENLTSENCSNFLYFSPGGLMSKEEIEDDIKLFDMLPSTTRDEMIKEQAYAWGRNIVKRLQSAINRQGDCQFLSDDELSSLVAEARAFAQIYYYGTAAVLVYDDYDTVIKQPIVGKSTIRYASLLNEIELVDTLLLSSNSHEIDAHTRRHAKLESLIDRLKSTRELCRDKRADLYVRASIHLIAAYYAEYNLSSRYITHNVIDTSLSSRKNKLINFRRKIKDLYKDVVNYEHKRNDDLEEKYSSIIRDLKLLEKALARQIKIVPPAQATSDALLEPFTKLTQVSFQDHANLNRLRAAVHDFSVSEINRIKTKWRMQ